MIRLFTQCRPCDKLTRYDWFIGLSHLKGVQHGREKKRLYTGGSDSGAGDSGNPGRHSDTLDDGMD